MLESKADALTDAMDGAERIGLLESEVDQLRRREADRASLVQIARINELEPYAYLRCLFTELPAAQTIEQVAVLLHWELPCAS